MAGHSHFANIKHKKNAQDQKKAKIFTKIQRNIMVALKSGLPDPALNTKLRVAMTAAREANLAKDKIDAIIKKFSAGTQDDGYEEIRYNAYANDGVALIIECLSDNKNRTAGDVRSNLTKHGGSLAETGSVEFMFDRLGIIKYRKNSITFDQMMEGVIEAGGEDLDEDENFYYISAQFAKTHEAADTLMKLFGEYETIETLWQPRNLIQLDQTAREKFEKILGIIEDLDDVQDIYHNADLSS